MFRRFYNLLFPLVFLFSLPAYLQRMLRRGNYRSDFGQRLGFYSAVVRARLVTGPPRLWLQAVSVGEVLVALKLIDALRQACPGLPLILSTTTTTGRQLASERAGQDVEVLYTPVDLAGAVRRAFDVLRPAQVIVVDGGLWPNLLWEARSRSVPTALVNARLSPRSERRFRFFRRFTAPLFSLLDLVCIVEASDASRWRELGVPAGRLHLTGSVKFDHATDGSVGSAPSSRLRETLDGLGFGTDVPVLLAGSTHPREEGMMAEIFLRLRPRFPALRLIVAPRHVERAQEVRAELMARGLTVLARTETLSVPAGRSAAAAPFDVLLLDTTGELAGCYELATVVFMGKSLAAVGGQNPAEAIAAGRPVVFGPHMENFRDLADQLLAAEGGLQVEDLAELEAVCARLLGDPAERLRLVTNGQRVLAAHRGAAARTAAQLLAGVKVSTCQGK